MDVCNIEYTDAILKLLSELFRTDAILKLLSELFRNSKLLSIY